MLQCISVVFEIKPKFDSAGKSMCELVTFYFSSSPFVISVRSDSSCFSDTINWFLTRALHLLCTLTNKFFSHPLRDKFLSSDCF